MKPLLAIAGLAALTLLTPFHTEAAEYRGSVSFAGLPLPGATLTATQGDKIFVSFTDLDGAYSFASLPDGDWSIKVEMLFFATVRKDIVVMPGVPAGQWTMQLLPATSIETVLAPAVNSASPPVAVTAPPARKASDYQRATVNESGAPAPRPEAGQDLDQDDPSQAADSLTINGSVNNAAASAFSSNRAFGNNRKGAGSLYNTELNMVFDNSALDARNYSLTGQDTPKAAQNHLAGGISFGGPLRIPHLIPARSAMNFFVAYQLSRNRNAVTNSYLTPTADQRSGAIAPGTLDPSTGQPFAGGVIPESRVSPQAISLLRFYPLPNFTGSRYNYQTPVTGGVDQDSLLLRLAENAGRGNQLSGSLAYQNTRNRNNNLFDFEDRTGTVGLQVELSWLHRFSNHAFSTAKVSFNRLSTDVAPNFANRENVSAEAGIAGNSQSPLDWGPPALVFAASNIAGLSDGVAARNRSQTASAGSQTYWAHGLHHFTFGGDVRRQQFNVLGQSNPRGVFTFTGAATGSVGSDFADFLLGVPDASSIAFGNADKYFRSSIYDAFITDDWRLTPGLTLNIGARWEYSAPPTEKYGRLVNLDVARGFTAEAPVVASSPVGSLTGIGYPASLVNPDKHGIQPRVGIAWRPIAASSMVVRAGYGVNYNTSVYQSIAAQMAQQAPLSKSVSVQNGAAAPLTLASGFNASPFTTPGTFGIDPNFRVGYSQTWQVSVQRDLPASLVMTATYLGIKGTRGAQEFLPNTYPTGVANPCPACLPGYIYLTSNGNSTNERGSLQLRRRLHNGMTATVQYTYAKAIDDTAPGGRGQDAAVIAQNWLDLSAERGLSSFDQRRQIAFQGQYTTGVGMRGGMLLEGWRGSAFKEWTITSAITAGSGLPLSPVYNVTVPGTGLTGSVRPDYTGAPLYQAPAGLFLNPAAYSAPFGHWGNAGRATIEGPGQLTVGASAARTFRLRERLSMDIVLTCSNPINHPTFQSWVTSVTSPQFGLPTAVNAMRTAQFTMRVRF